MNMYTKYRKVIFFVCFAVVSGDFARVKNITAVKTKQLTSNFYYSEGQLHTYLGNESAPDLYWFS